MSSSCILVAQPHYLPMATNWQKMRQMDNAFRPNPSAMVVGG
jgi:hypothetical protein